MSHYHSTFFPAKIPEKVTSSQLPSYYSSLFTKLHCGFCPWLLCRSWPCSIHKWLHCESFHKKRKLSKLNSSAEKIRSGQATTGIFMFEILKEYMFNPSSSLVPNTELSNDFSHECLSSYFRKWHHNPPSCLSQKSECLYY